MRRFFMIAVVLLTTVMANAQDNSNRIGVGFGAFYRPAFYSRRGDIPQTGHPPELRAQV